MQHSEIADFIHREMRGRWPELLAYYGIIVNPLRNTPCPICGGHDRFVFGDLNGDGTFFCRGGANGGEHSGNGWTLLQQSMGWDWRTAQYKAREFLGCRAAWTPFVAPVTSIHSAQPKSSASRSQKRDYAHSCWNGAQTDPAHAISHPYAIRKGITSAAGARRGIVSGRVIGKNADCLIITALRFPDLEVQAIQCINAQGEKQTFGPLMNHGFLLGDLEAAEQIIIVEGWADCASMVLHHGCPAAVAALGKSNLQRLAEHLSNSYPDKKIIVLEDSE